jgi:two-component system, OmpR family, response regulator
VFVSPRRQGPEAIMRILVVEDEKSIADDIASTLGGAQYVVEVVSDGEAAWFRAGTEEYDGVVLDLGLPRLDGLSVLRKLRAAGIRTPVLILTARGSWMERVEGIDAGADDYLPKPFQSEELLARLGAIMRRSVGQASPLLEVGTLRVDARRAVATVSGKPINLTSLEYRALRYLLHHRGRPVPQGELAEHVYGAEEEPDSNAVEVLVGRLRRKVGADVIETRRGYGYVVKS